MDEDVIEEVNEGTSEVVENQDVKTYSEEEVEQIKAQLKEDYESKFDNKFNKRWARESSKLEREYAEKDELINLLKEQTGAEDLSKLLDMSYSQYGIDRPNIVNQKDEEKLGKIDAQEILELDDEAIEDEANRLADIKNRSAREQATFMELGKYLTDKKQEQKRRKEILDAGIDESVYNDLDFQKYMNNFKEDTPLKFIYDNYTKSKEKVEDKKPFSPGSAKGTNKKDLNEVKDYYTYEESLQFTRADFDKNPKLFEAVENSMTRWGRK